MSVNKMSLTLHPITDDVQVIFERKDTPRSISMPDQGIIEMGSMVDGQYKVTVLSLATRPKLELCSLMITKNDGRLSVQTVELNSSNVEIQFMDGDEKLTQANVIGTFTGNSGGSVEITGKTDDSGVFQTTLPPGKIEKLKAIKGSKVVTKNGVITVPSPNKLGTPIRIGVSINTLSFGDSLYQISDKSRVVVLGDVSGSMSSENRMDILKRSGKEVIEICKKKNCPLALGVWNSWVNWSSKNWIETDHQRSQAHNWVSNLNPGGGNDMRYSIEECMRTFSNVEDILIMCDGDISPFSCPGGKTQNVNVDVPKPSSEGNESSGTYYNETSWEEFRKRFPQVRFHFIALSKSAQSDKLQHMSSIGNGIFWEFT